MRTVRLFATAVAIPVLLAACSESNPNEEGFTGGGDKFFNPVDRTKMVDKVSGSMVDIYKVIDAVDIATLTGMSNDGEQRLRRIAGTVCETGSSTVDTSLPFGFFGSGNSGTSGFDFSDMFGSGVSISDSGGSTVGVDINFDNCVSAAGVTSDGALSIGVDFSFTGFGLVLDFDNLTTIVDGETSSVDGVFTVSSGGWLSAPSTTITGETITIVSAGQTVVFSDYSLTKTISSNGLTFSGGATITTNGETIVLSLDELATAGGQFPVTGGYTVTNNNDNSTLTVDADTGDDETYDVVIDGETQEEQGDWNDSSIVEFGPLSLD